MDARPPRVRLNLLVREGLARVPIEFVERREFFATRTVRRSRAGTLGVV